MKETRLQTVLLVAVLLLAIAVLLKTSHRTQRFVPDPDEDSLMLDTQTGQVCWGIPPKNGALLALPLCKNVR